MSIHLLHAALHAAVGCTVAPSRDGILLTQPGGSQHDLVTCHSDEGGLLALLDALAGALRARGAVAAALPAPLISAAPVMPLAFTSALPVANVEVPPDIVIAGGKVTQVKKVEQPKWVEVEQPAPVPVAVKRRAKGGK